MSKNWNDLEKMIIELNSSSEDEFDFFDRVVKETKDLDLDLIFGNQNVPAIQQNLVPQAATVNRSAKEQAEYNKIKAKMETRMRKEGKVILVKEKIEKSIVNGARPSGWVKFASSFSYIVFVLVIIAGLIIGVFAAFGGSIKAGDFDSGISYQVYAENLLYYGEYDEDLSESNLALQSRLSDVPLKYWGFDEDPNNPGVPRVVSAAEDPDYRFKSEGSFISTEFYGAVSSTLSIFDDFNAACFSGMIAMNEYFFHLYNVSLDWIFDLEKDSRSEIPDNTNEWDPVGSFDILDYELGPFESAKNEVINLFTSFENPSLELKNALDYTYNSGTCPSSPLSPSEAITLAIENGDVETLPFPAMIISDFETYETWTLNDALGIENELIEIIAMGEEELSVVYNDFNISILIFNYGTLILLVSFFIFSWLIIRLGSGKLNTKWISILVGLIAVIIPGLLILFGTYRKRNDMQLIANELKLELYGNEYNIK